MSVLLVRLRPGIDRSALNFLPVAVRERPGSSAISAGDSCFWHGAQYPPGADRQGQTILPGFRQRFLASAQSRSKNGFGSRDQLETSFPSCALRVCSRSQALTAGDWTAFQSPSGNVLEAPQSPQVSVRSGMGLSIRRHPGLATVPPSPPRVCLALLHAVIVPSRPSSKGVSDDSAPHVTGDGAGSKPSQPHAGRPASPAQPRLTSPGLGWRTRNDPGV